MTQIHTQPQPQTDDPCARWLQLRAAIRHALEATGRSTIGDVCDMPPEQVLGLYNVGRTNLRELEQELARYNLSLRPDNSPRVAKKNQVDAALSLLHTVERDLDQLRRRVAGIRQSLLREVRRECR